MFHALKGGLKLRNMTDKAAPYFPCRYLRRMLVAYMANNRDLIWKHKEASLRGRYGLEGGDDCPEPISYKEYLTRMLKRGQWGDDIVAGSLELAYSLIWGSHKIWGKGGGDTLDLL